MVLSRQATYGSVSWEGETNVIQKLIGLVALVILVITGCNNQEPSLLVERMERDRPVVHNIDAATSGDALAPPKETPVDYQAVFLEAHGSVERWNVIRQHHLVSAIESLSAHGEAIVPFLIDLTESERYAQRGWPFWALVCGTLAKVGGEEGAVAMKNLKEDEKAYKHTREYAEKALAGEWPPDSVIPPEINRAVHEGR